MAMTLQHIYERVHQRFPNVPFSQVKDDANRIVEEFCEETGVYYTNSNLTLTTAVSYALPATALFVYAVEVYDANGDELKDTLTYTIKDGYIYFADEYGENLDEMPDEVSVITLRYSSSPTAMSAITDTPSIANKWQRAIIAKLYAEYHAAFGDPNQVKLHETRYLAVVKAAKRTARLRQWLDPDINLDRENF